MTSTSALASAYQPDDALIMQIIEAATRLITERGYRAVHLDDVARDVGLTTVGLVDRVGSLEELFLAVLAHRDVQDIVSVREQSSAGVRAAFRESMHHLMLRNSQQPNIVELYLDMAARALDPASEAHAYFVQRYEESVEIMADLVAEVASSPIDVGMHVIAAMDGLELQWMMSGQSFDLVAAWDRVAERILAAT